MIQMEAAFGIDTSTTEQIDKNNFDSHCYQPSINNYCDILHSQKKTKAVQSQAGNEDLNKSIWSINNK